MTGIRLGIAYIPTNIFFSALILLVAAQLSKNLYDVNSKIYQTVVKSLKNKWRIKRTYAH